MNPRTEVTSPTSAQTHDVERSVLEVGRWVHPLKAEIGKVIVGQREMVDGLLVGLLTGGHILLEGPPGLAKTLALRTLAAATEGNFQRIQFTPDMLPADIVGTVIYEYKSGQFTTRHGPVFTNLLLADEINRAPAKVQSALLEAMQERQVTLGDETHELPSPFLVMATQNPIEHEGTYPLPEAQLDRFLMKLLVEYPNRQEELAIVKSMARSRPATEVSKVVSLETIEESRVAVDLVYMSDSLERYVVDIVHATREPAVHGLADLGPRLLFGASPRASIGLVLAAKAAAFIEGRPYVTPHDVKHMAPMVLRHRIAVTYAAEAEGTTPDDVVRRILDTLPTP